MGELADARAQLWAVSLEDEEQALLRILRELEFYGVSAAAEARAAALVQAVRARTAEQPLLDSFLQEFGLDNSEGIALMCLAEALLRIPDDATADRLIAEKLARADWSAHEGRSASLFVNASTWGLMLTGRMVELPAGASESPAAWVTGLMRRMGEPVVRAAFRQAMRIIGGEFVLGRDIDEALARSRADGALRLCSFDMLGEGARTDADALRYLEAYGGAIERIGAEGRDRPLPERSGLSIKLSALEPRYQLLQRERVLQRLGERARLLAQRAAAQDIGLSIDAEEAERLDLSLAVLEWLARDPATRAWTGLGVVVQAYSKRALPLIDWLAALARDTARVLNVRLVKGAYWDTEIKRAQERGLADYPVFTRKVATDASYLACAQRLFNHRGLLYPQFATHNAHSLAAVLALRPTAAPMEFQRLHGMGLLLYDEARRQFADFPAVRTYAPVGRHEELLAYLVRRLLENGANTSFVNRVMDATIEVPQLVRDPVLQLRAECWRNRGIPLPVELYGAARRNSQGVDFGDPIAVEVLYRAVAPPERTHLTGANAEPIRNPADARQIVGTVRWHEAAEIAQCFDRAAGAQLAWNAAGASQRAACLDRAAARLAVQRPELLYWLVKEAGKTLGDAISEAREAEDMCRYYAAQARQQLAEPRRLVGPTGERNELSLHGRGVFACISPWNFPLAIFLGQVAAASVAGNAVVAKPAEATPLIAELAVRILHEAGVPEAALQLVQAPGREFGAAAFVHPKLCGVAFTGSTATARHIQRALAERDGPLLPLIAETGGLNAMIVDSSALLEQAVDDIVQSAFNSAGQRCSALRVLWVQEEVADRLLELIAGAMQELVIGDPACPATDIGPVIGARAQAELRAHVASLRREARIVAECPLDAALARGYFVAPCCIELRDSGQLTREVFGPILHVLRYRSGELPRVLQAIGASGYGLTLGIHSRIEGLWNEICAGTRVGNIYVNRNMIGATVGVQPFGGEGLSGTGPKAGGPHYLPRFCTERTLSINTAATGGNAELLSAGNN